MNDCGRVLRLLLVEDNRGDAFLIKEMLRDTGIDLKITVAEDGQKGLDILSRANGNDDGRIDFVILDLNLPKVNGFEVLSYMKSMHGLKNIPVVIMTGSLNKDYRTRATSLGAANFLIKPSSNDEFEVLVDWMKGALAQPERIVPGNCPPQAGGFEERLGGSSGLMRGPFSPSGLDRFNHGGPLPDISDRFGPF
jgi:chemotaxis family two-component system response regulator Rcp1